MYIHIKCIKYCLPSIALLSLVHNRVDESSQLATGSLSLSHSRIHLGV